MPDDVKLVFSSLPADIAENVEADYAGDGFGVSSNAASYRMFDDVPSSYLRSTKTTRN